MIPGVGRQSYVQLPKMKLEFGRLADLCINSLPLEIRYLETRFLFKHLRLNEQFVLNNLSELIFLFRFYLLFIFPLFFSLEVY